MATYPAHLVRHVILADGAVVTIRPVRPADAGLTQAFVRGLSGETRYFRFMDPLRELTPQMVAHFTAVDYERHLGLIAVRTIGEAQTQIGAARYVVDAAGSERSEFSIVVADDWQHRGLGRLLMQVLIAEARGAGVRTMYGDVLAGNARMLRFAARLGFVARAHESDPHLVRVELSLGSASDPADAV